MTKKTNSSSSLTLKEILATSRPFSWVNTAAPFIVGYLLATHTLDVTGIIGMIYFLFSYNLLMYGVNDIYDYESDIKNPRKNSIEGGLLEKHKHAPLWYAIAAANMPFLLYLLYTGTTAARIALLGLVFFCFSYSAKPLRFKEVPFLDSINSAIHFAGPFVFGLIYGQSTNWFIPAIIAFIAWGMASQAFGAIQDIKPDRAAKIKSIATFLGAKRTNRYVLFFYSLSCIVVAVSYFPVGIIAAGFLGLYVLNASFFIKYKSDAQSTQFHRGWQNFMWLNLIVGFWLSQLLLYIFDPFGVKQYYVTLLGFFLLLFFLIQLGLTLYNLRAFARPKTQRLNEWPKISIIMHAYNQADNISSTLLAILGQQYPQFEILFTDLGSSDNTLKIAQGFQDPRLKIVQTKPLKAGWTLNSWVSQQLLEKATGEIVLLLSADTILLPNALSIIASLITEQELSLVSLLPADQNKSLAQQIILSQNHYFMLGLYPSAFLAKTHPRSVNASTNIMAFVRSSISTLGGFKLVSKSALEDFDLAAEVKTKGLQTGFYLGADIATSQNHSSLGLIIAQNIRRFYPAVHFQMPLTIALSGGGFFVLLLPSIILAWLLITSSFTGILLLALAIGLSYINRLIITIVSKQSILSTLLYPIGSICGLGLLIYSMISYELRKPRWQKRNEVF
ncbi:prenyltransferase [Candidatus Saccharibacteria bacterium]|nr:prenyltransferase [Candidatus Saccharibacteria bacterium]